MLKNQYFTKIMFSLFRIAILSVMFFINSAFANKNEVTLITFDTLKSNEEAFNSNMPRNFRDLNDPSLKIGINAIASGQFTEEELLALKQKYSKEKIMIVDLRLESHSFVNGIPISWRSPFDKSNLGKTANRILFEEQQKSLEISKNSSMIISEIIKKDVKNGWYSEIIPVIVNVKKVETEYQMAKRNGFDYKRFDIKDHSPPSEKQLEEIVDFIKKVPADTKLYVHCAAGKGRTTTFLTIYDIIKNGSTTSLEDIFKRQNKIGGSKLDKIEEDEKWREDLAKERLELITKFYQKYKNASIQ